MIREKYINNDLTIEESTRKCLLVFQSFFNDSSQHATEKEEDFIIASLKVQRDTNSKRLFTKKVLSEYKKYGFNRNSINNYSKSISLKYLGSRTEGELTLLPILEEIIKNGKFEILISINTE